MTRLAAHALRERDQITAPVTDTKEQRPNILFQTSTMAALLDAVYDGETSVRELLEHGNFGLGTFNALDGEMIVHEGAVHQFRAEGQAGKVSDDQLTPFACVTRFEPEQRLSIGKPTTKADFEAMIDARIGNPNLIVAVRFSGLFEEVLTRTVFCQCHPFPKLLDVVAKQPTTRLARARGVMLGFRTPAYLQGLNVAGYHLHFLDDDARRGGHLIDYRLIAGEVELAVISDIEIQLPRSETFAAADLAPDGLHDAIRTAEG